MTDYDTKADTPALPAFEDAFAQAQAEALTPRLDALDAGLAALEQKLERKMAALATAGRRPPLTATRADYGDDTHRAAGERYLRKGWRPGWPASNQGAQHHRRPRRLRGAGGDRPGDRHPAEEYRRSAISPPW